MYSGSDSNESQKFPPWTLNPATYQNMSNDQVDWAALAQQWIIMKEAGPPPVPGETPSSYAKDSKKEEKFVGSSTDAQKEKSQSAVGAVWNANETIPPPGADAWNYAQNQSWGNWSNTWVSPTIPPPPNIGPQKAPLLPTPANNYGIPTETENDNAVHYSNSEYTTASGGYWTAPPADTAAPAKHIKPHNKRYSKVNVPVRVSAPLPPVAVVESTMPTLDANKRKQLPAWIREGLEKMEKDKLKQLEKEKQKKQREEYLEKNKKNDKETMEILKSTMRERQKSKFESDGEESEGEPKKPRSAAASPERIPLTPDELMIKVRRTMTEILLTVTNRQIETICREELQRFLKRHKASDLRSAAPTGGATLSAKLGLGMYGEGSDSSSEEEDENSQSYSRDSDDDLKETIRRKKADFQRTEREIEERLEEAERRKRGSRSRSSSPESNDNDSQVDARAEDPKYKQDDYPSPVNKSYEKSKNKSPASYSDVSDYSNDRSQKSRRSSSSESNESYKKSKSKYRSRSKSYSPDRRHRSTRWSRSKSPARERDSTSSRRDSGSSRKKSSRRSRSRSYSRSRRSRSSSYRRSRRSTSRERSRRTRSRSSTRSRYSSSRSERRRRRRSRSNSSSRGKRSHRH